MRSHVVERTLNSETPFKWQTEGKLGKEKKEKEKKKALELKKKESWNEDLLSERFAVTISLCLQQSLYAYNTLANILTIYIPPDHAEECPSSE